jgi:hypothetical protein
MHVMTLSGKCMPGNPTSSANAFSQTAQKTLSRVGNAVISTADTVAISRNSNKEALKTSSSRDSNVQASHGGVPVVTSQQKTDLRIISASV